MKRYIILVISIIIMILSFLNSWFFDELYDHFFIFCLIPSIIIFIAWIMCLIFTITKIGIENNKINDLSLIILLITALIILFVPFRETKVKIELSLYEKERQEIINMIKNNKLKMDELGNIVLPKKYKKVSIGGEVTVRQNNKDGQVITFWVFRGMQSGSTELIYSTGGKELIKDNEGGHPIVSIEKLKDNWYYVITDY